MWGIDFNELFEATYDTIYMSLISTVFVAVFGLLIGILLYCTSEQGITPNKLVYSITSAIVNVLRSIPFVILIILLLPFTKFLVGTIIGSKAFLPGLIIASSPFYARMVETSLKEVDKGVIEAAYSLGASNFTIIKKVLLKEALPSLISGITITCIAIVGYSAMAGIIGGGGLGELARRYGYVKNNPAVTLAATIAALLIVLVVQFTGDKIAKKYNKREVE
ncbi:methionine ABC transporter permease [Mycoplasma sp. P36-A1]|uniref:methionine ABC transporter permease n=1 Tax=Mycoplasma sp. P36-A1 TaxID=3252900 RepID=UPI003C2B5B48